MYDDNVTMQEFINIACTIIGIVCSGIVAIYFLEKRDRKLKKEES
jgi:hypothetical protein